jgi:prevent-host-death family protein
MPRIVTAEDLRARLGRELDALRETDEALYVSKRGRLAAVVLDSEHYAQLIERLEYLEDSLAALEARDEREATVPWTEVRE